jgi:orotate phosphoribosyltransferase
VSRAKQPPAEPAGIDPDVLQRINRGIILRTGAYLTNDHFVLRSGRHTAEYVEKALVTTEPAFTEGLGEVIARHFAEYPIDVVAAAGPGAVILGHCVARSHAARPRLLYASKQRDPNGPAVVLLPKEFLPLIQEETKVLVVEDILTTGRTIRLLQEAVEARGGRVVGIGTIWTRDRSVSFGPPLFTLIDREFRSYDRAECPMCRKGIPINGDYGCADSDE